MNNVQFKLCRTVEERGTGRVDPIAARNEQIMPIWLQAQLQEIAATSRILATGHDAEGEVAFIVTPTHWLAFEPEPDCRGIPKMTRRFINMLSDGEAVDQVFVASEKQLRTNRNGNLYLQLRLSDKTGSMTAMLWNAHQRHFDGFDNGDYVHVQGTAQLYNGNMQVLAKQVERSRGTDIDESDFVTLSNTQLESIIARVAEILRGIQNPHLRNLVDTCLAEESFMANFRAAPAGIKNHHAYHGGLAEHILSLMELCLLVGPRYPRVNLDLLLVGAFVHDIGKLRELTYSPDLGYSDSGQLIGHLVQGVQIIDEMIRKSEEQTGESFPQDLADQIRHFIVSHHGTLEFGSPKVPMTLEAVTLHYLDSLDAKIHHFEKMIDEDPNKESRWTVYHPNIGRKIFKGLGNS